MSAIQFFNDPDHRTSEGFAFIAERAAKAGNIDEAKQKYLAAAEPEYRLAQRIGVDGSEPLLRSLFAVSAISLYLKAQKWDMARTAACVFLASPDLLTQEGQVSISGLLDRIRREAFTAKAILAAPGSASIDMVLDGGRVLEGQTPWESASARRDIMSKTITRVSEWKTGRPFRKRGLSAVGQALTIYEQPSFSGSFGIRFLLSKGPQPDSLFENEGISPSDIIDQIIEFAQKASEDPEELSKIVNDEDYSRSILSAFRDLSGDGATIGSVTLSSGRSHTNFVKLDSSCRVSFSQKLSEIEHPEATPISFSGILKIVNLRAPQKIGVEVDGKIRNLKIEPSVHDDTIGSKVNRNVFITGSGNQTGTDGEVDDWAYDIQLIE